MSELDEITRLRAALDHWEAKFREARAEVGRVRRVANEERVRAEAAESALAAVRDLHADLTAQVNDWDERVPRWVIARLRSILAAHTPPSATEPIHDDDCDSRGCTHCEVCGVGVLYGSRCSAHPMPDSSGEVALPATGVTSSDGDLAKRVGEDLVALGKAAHDRGDSHEYRHALAALRAGDSTTCTPDRCHLDARHTSSDGDRGLSEKERAMLVDAFRSSSRSPEHLAFLAEAAVERILAARTAQPEGVERVEWSTWIAREQRGYDDRSDAQRRAERDGSAVVRRTVTEYAPVVTPWEVVGDEQP